MDLGQYSVVGLAVCGIYYCKENFNRFISKANNYIKNHQTGESNFPFYNLVVDLKLRCNTSCFNLQIAPTSSNNEYAVISGSTYSIFKVTEKGRNNFYLTWNDHSYNIAMEKKVSNFKLTVNHNNIVYVDKVEYPLLHSSFIDFPTNYCIQSDELNTILDSCLLELNNVLSGYILPEPFFSSNLFLLCENIFSVLRDPLLPALQFQRYVEESSPALTSNLISDLQHIIGQYTSNFSSLFSRFPSNKIKSLIEKYLETINDNNNRLNVAVTLRPMLELAEMYSGGIRGNAKHVLDKIFLDYLKVEVKFQDDETKNSTNFVNKRLSISDMISHNVLPEKNKMILILVEFLEKFLPGIILDLKSTIKRLLNGLNGSLYSQVISKLREILITGQMPSYEIRKNEMEAIFLNSINGSSNCVQTNRLENLICSNSEVFDIISDFFFHKMIAIRKCAMEVYIRRAYIVYDICSFEQSQLASGELCVLFKFSLPTNNRQRNMICYERKRSNSYVALINGKAALMRKTSQTSRSQFCNSSGEKEDISDGELSNDDFQPEFLGQRSLDYDTDSAISVGTFSQSEFSSTVYEQVDNDSLLENGAVKCRHSPSVHSLDKLWISPIYSSIKETAENIKISNNSLDGIFSSKHNRHASMFINNPPQMQFQDFSGPDNLGVMIIFNTLTEVEKNLPAIKDLLIRRNSGLDDMDFHEYNNSNFDLSSTPVHKVVMKLILRDPDLTSKSDNDNSVLFSNFCDKYMSFFEEIRVLRITFLLQSTDKTIRYFTFRYKSHFEEDIKLRNIDPILSFQLEINRLRNYHLERLPLPNRRMYVYMGICKDMTITSTAQYRMFSRCIIHHKDFYSSTSNIDHMAKEAERNLLESMDAIDMAWVDERACLTNANHIFFYFHSILCINKIDELENVVRAIIFKHGRRLWSLRITQAELKMSVKVNNGSVIPIRLWVHNEGGQSLDICVYREEFHFKTDYKVLVSWSIGKDGRYHGVPVDCFYSL